MADSLISSASLGSQTQWGTHDVTNAALDARVSGKDSFFTGRVLVSSTNAVFYFDFVDSFVDASLRFDFTPTQRPVTSVGVGDVGVFGSFAVSNVAQGAIFIGFGLAATRVARIVVSDRAAYLFDFVDASQAHLPVQLSFSGQQIVVAHGSDFSRFGNALLPAQVGFFGDAYLQFGVNVRALPATLLDFGFITGPAIATPSVHLPFSGGIVAPLVGLNATQWGVGAVANVSQGVLFAGLGDTSVVSKRALLSRDLHEAVVTFNFLFGPSTVIPALQLSFSSNRRANFVGYDGVVFGAFSTAHSSRIYFDAFDSLLSGVADVLGGYKTAVVVGNEFTAFGTDWYVGAARVLPLGAHSLFIGNLTVVGAVPPSLQHALLEGLASLLFGTAWVSNAIRFLVDVGMHFDSSQLGTLWASHLVRDVAPVGWHSFLPGFSHLGTHQHFETVSFVPFTQFGDAYLYIRALYPEGFDAAVVCETFFVSRSPRAVDVFSWDSALYGAANVFNLLRFVVFNPPDTNPDTYHGAVFGRPWRTFVDNRNRAVQFAGFDASRFAWYPADVLPGAAALEAHGFVATGFQAFPDYHLVAHRVRSVLLQGADVFVVTGRHHVVATGRPLFVEGHASMEFGAHRLQRMLHFVRMFQLVSGAVSDSWVSHDPRFVNTVSTRASLYVSAVRVSFTPLQIGITGIDSFSFWDFKMVGLPIPTIRPFSAQPHLIFGEGFVWNVTPEIRPVGKPMFEDANNKHRVEFLHRTLFFEGFGSFGRSLPIVKDSRQWAFFIGLCRTLISDAFTVHNDMPDPPYTKYVYLYWSQSMDDVDVFVHGCSRFGRALVRFNIIWLDSFEHETRFGTHRVVSNGILFEMSKHYLPWGMLEMGSLSLSGGLRKVSVFWTPGEHLFVADKFRVTPHTIWLWENPPIQAKVNHPPWASEYIVVDSADALTSNTGVFPFFGVTRVLGSTQYVKQYHDAITDKFLAFGEFVCDLFNRALDAKGLAAFRSGYPRIFARSTQLLDDVSLGSTCAFGGLQIYPWNFPVVLPVQGLDNFIIGQHIAMLFNRNVFMQGEDLTVYGNNDPMVYHYPRGPHMNASEVTQWGVPWFSHAPRTLDMASLDSLSMRSLPYARRMRVMNYIRAFKIHGGNNFFAVGTHVVLSGKARVGVYGINPPCASPWFVVRRGT